MKHEQLLSHLAGFALEQEKLRDELRAGMAAFDRGTRIEAARNRPVSGSGLSWAGSGRLVGWSLRAVGGPATLLLHDGRDTFGDVLASIGLAGDNAADARWMGPGGVWFGEALYVEVAAGTVTGALWLGAVD